ncbi:MAG: hypothetical protein IAE80_26490 [Anaerolinea sp.]|nr:hypothetical protein [Anaerolinea sp.]
MTRSPGQVPVLTYEIHQLVQQLGKGKVYGVAYDTAWAGRLAARYDGFDHSLEWLRRNQYEDGTWGAPVLHFHDRFISTLASIITLREVGQHPRDKRRVRRGEEALWKLIGHLGKDDSDTVGFPILSTSLAEEAKALGLDVPQPPVRYHAPYHKKVSALLSQPVRPWRKSTITFSLEALQQAVTDSDDVLEGNCSVSISPAATAAYLLNHPVNGALDYLLELIAEEGNGGVPAFGRIDIFEMLWSLMKLRLTNLIQPDDPPVRAILDYLASRWSPECGISYSTHFPVVDIDDTAATFMLLKWGGYNVSADVFAYFEKEDHFCCYQGETNPSPSTHLRLLDALRYAQDHPLYVPWVQKTIAALKRFDANGSFWSDKWHTSPYYVSNLAIHALRGVDDELAASRMKWIMKTQNDDGGWGYLGGSTPEETAYALEALVTWDRTVDRVDETVMAQAAQYLAEHLNDAQYTPLWISKGLYTPHYIVRATILSALYQYHA